MFQMFRGAFSKCAQHDMRPLSERVVSEYYWPRFVYQMCKGHIIPLGRIDILSRVHSRDVRKEQGGDRVHRLPAQFL